MWSSLGESAVEAQVPRALARQSTWLRDQLDGLRFTERRLGYWRRVGKLLAIYLNDHLAGATLGVGLARRMQAANQGDPEFGPELAEICAEIERDRETLEAVMEKLGVARSRVKPLAAAVGERLGRLKLNGRLWGYSPLSRLDELELLQLGVAGKRRLWQTLEQTHSADLGDVELDALAERATGQLKRLESLHRKAATLALL
jgi:hypothetical protein